jgi:hypothetical protein
MGAKVAHVLNLELDTSGYIDALAILSQGKCPYSLHSHGVGPRAGHNADAKIKSLYLPGIELGLSSP